MSFVQLHPEENAKKKTALQFSADLFISFPSSPSHAHRQVTLSPDSPADPRAAAAAAPGPENSARPWNLGRGGGSLGWMCQKRNILYVCIYIYVCMYVRIYIYNTYEKEPKKLAMYIG